MIDNLICIDDSKLIGTYVCNGKKIELHKSDIRRIWNYEDDGTFIKLHCNEMDQVYGIITIAQGQGGVAVVWDGPTGEIVHISDASYAVDIAVTEKAVYTLLDISNFVTPSTARLFRCDFGKMIVNKESEEVKTDMPQDLFRNKGLSLEEIVLYVDDDNGIVDVDGVEGGHYSFV